METINESEYAGSLWEDDDSQPSQSGSPWASHHLVNTIPGFRQCHSSGDSQASWDKDSTDDGSRFDTDNWNDSPTSQPGITKKRKRSGGNYRVHRAKHAPLGPSFPAIESCEKPGQSKAIDWRKLRGKREFDRCFGHLMARLGGVKPAHQGSCVLCPDDLRALEPSDLLDFFRLEQLPGQHAKPMMYEYIDHSTEMAYATAWFRSDDWPHNGLSFDNFLGIAVYRPMTSSHPCNQNNCLVHVSYETIDTKRSRKSCVDRAKATRLRGQDISPTCSIHNPPCLLQVRYSFRGRVIY